MHAADESPPNNARVVVQESSFSATLNTVGGLDVVRLVGELDMAAQELAFSACVTGTSVSVVVDLSELTFLDCAAYGRLLAACHVLAERGGSLRIRGAVGQPERLLRLVQHDFQAA